MASILRQLARVSTRTRSISSLHRQTNHITCLLYTSRPFCKKIIDYPDQGPPIPEWVQPKGETLEVKRARLLYQSRKRGMSENGLLLSTFAHIHLDSFTDEQLDIYDRLINQPSNDWDIFYWMTKVKPTPEVFDNEVMDMLKQHALNEKMEMRIVQPDLKEIERN